MSRIDKAEKERLTKSDVAKTKVGYVIVLRSNRTGGMGEARMNPKYRTLIVRQISTVNNVVNNIEKGWRDH